MGIALARLGDLAQALSYFERVDPDRLYRLEYPVFFNEYAYVLAQAGRMDEAQQLLRGARRDHWTEPQRRWAADFLASRPSRIPPHERMKRRLLH